jgi:hypothetical protein
MFALKVRLEWDQGLVQGAPSSEASLGLTFGESPIPCILMDLSMVALEGANTSFPLPAGFNALGGRNGCGQGGPDPMIITFLMSSRLGI